MSAHQTTELHERALIGYLIQAPRTLDTVSSIVRTRDFYRPYLGSAFGHLARLHLDPNMELTPAALVDRLTTDDLVTRNVNPAVFVFECIQEAATYTHAAAVDSAWAIRRQSHQRDQVEAWTRYGQALEGGDEAKAAEAWTAVALLQADVEEAALAGGKTRHVDLTAYLDGTVEKLLPSIGARRADGQAFLYPGKWHTCIGLTTAGKSWWALWHVVAELRKGNTVVYAHFEESDPGGTIDRLRAMAPDLGRDVLLERFVWLDCTELWGKGEFARALPDGTTLVTLDGINAACAQHGWKVNEPEAVGAYREYFVRPAAKLGAAVLSLGHPPKARDRQQERHGFGATGWLDEVDGVGYRMEGNAREPLGLNRRGHSYLLSVKDRPSQVQVGGEPDTKREAGWFRMGTFTLDSTSGVRSYASMSKPVVVDVDEEPLPPSDEIGEIIYNITNVLQDIGGSFETAGRIEVELRARNLGVATAKVAAALTRMKLEGVIEWPEVKSGQKRPGRLTRQIAPEEGVAVDLQPDLF